MSVAEMEHELISDNLAAFGRYLPELCAILSKHVPVTTLVENPDGSCDVEFRGQRLYDVKNDGATGPELARRSVEALRGSTANRVYLQPLDSKSIDVSTSRFVTGMLERAVEEGVAFRQHPTDDNAYHLVVFGLGLGYHLVELLELAEPYSICIVEPNRDFLYHSLATMDWRPILERRAAWPQSLTIVTAENADEIAHRVRTHCRNANPTALDSMLVFDTYPNDTMELARRIFHRDAHLIHQGLGFFVDELEMVRASYNNLVIPEDFRIFRRHDKPVGVPAFIVGSGPSIDDDIDFIRDNQDKAVILSCGSALGVLLANGVRPDFQLILENGEQPYEMLKTIAKSHSFDGIRLVASNTVNPKMRELFDERIYFIRQALSSYAMFTPGQEYTLDHSGPTVTNTGLETALKFGFNNIFLFGCDLGARRADRHHSQFSPYEMADRKAEYEASVVFSQKFPHTQLGNFGGIVHTNEIMTWSRDSMETSIKSAFAGQTVTNCSDGIKIKGARAQVSGAVKLPHATETKAAAIARLVEHCPKAQVFDFKNRFKQIDWRGQVRAYADRLIAVVDARPGRSQEFLHRIAPLLIPDFERMPNFEEYFLRGTLFVSIIAADYYTRRAHPPEKRAAFRDLMYQGVVDLIETMVAQTDWFFDHLDGLRSNDELKEGINAWI